MANIITVPVNAPPEKKGVKKCISMKLILVIIHISQIKINASLFQLVFGYIKWSEFEKVVI